MSELEFLESPVLRTLGEVGLHFLWQGLALGVVTAIVLGWWPRDYRKRLSGLDCIYSIGAVPIRRVRINYFRGFTLIELLSTVAIIGILAALMMTAITTARTKSRRLVCLNNVRQIGNGINLFATDHGEYPLAFNGGRPRGRDMEHQTSWQSSVQKQLNPGSMGGHGSVWMTTGIWDCPSGTRPNDWPTGSGYSDYGYNANGLGIGVNGTAIGIGGSFNAMAPTTAPAIKIVEVVNPTEAIAAGDGFTGWGDVVEDGLWSMSRWANAKERLNSTGRCHRRHDAKANIVFCDGHAEALSLRFLFVDTSDESLRIWNRDNLPHRERLK